jgi:hypothetical protein
MLTIEWTFIRIRAAEFELHKLGATRCLIGTPAQNYTAGSDSSPNFFHGGSESPRSGRHHEAHGASRGSVGKRNDFLEPRQGRHQRLAHKRQKELQPKVDSSS